MIHSFCIVYSNLGLGGIPTKIVDVVNQMTVSHPKTRIYILLKKHQAFSLRSSITNPNVTVNNFPDRYPCKSVLFVLWIWFYIYSYKPSTILSFISPYAIPVLATKLIFFWRKTFIIVSEDHFTSGMIRNMAFPSVQYWGVRLLYPLANVIIVPTRAVKNDLQNSFGTPPSNIHVIANWSKYTKLPIDKTKRIYDCIYVGRFEKTKNILPLVSLLATIIQKHKFSLSCLLMGEGSEGEACEQFVRRQKLSKNILILPPTADFAAYLKQSKILVYNPEKNTEGFPNSILDAMGCGTIVITKNFYGASEVINNDNGYIVKTEKEMTERILCVLHHYGAQRSRIKLAKQHVLRHNSLANVRQYIERLNV